MRSAILISFLSTIALSAPIGGVSVLVKNSPITMGEVQREMKLSGTDATKSADALIRKKLELLEAKEKKITVSKSEIQEEMERMAKQNNLSMEQFLDAMKSARGLDEEDLKTKIEENIRGQKLYSAIAFSKMTPPSAEEEEEYYQLHLDQFSHPERYEVTAYFSASPEVLQAKLSDPMQNIEGVMSKDESIASANINPQLAQILNGIEIGKFSPIIPNGKDRFMSFYMRDKPNMVTESLESVRAQVSNMIMGEKRNQVLNDYFTRLRLNAEIKVLRLP